MRIATRGGGGINEEAFSNGDATDPFASSARRGYERELRAKLTAREHENED